MYCSGYGCEASHLVAAQARGGGIQAAILHEGWPAWTDAGYPVKEGRAAVKVLRHPAVHWVAAIVLGASSSMRAWTRSRTPSSSRGSSTGTGGRPQRRRWGSSPPTLVAVVLPWLEAVAGVLLVTGFWRREAAAVAGVLLAVFVVAVGYALARGIDVENCGCFTRRTAPAARAGWTLIASDLGLLAASLYVLLVRSGTVASASAAEPVPAA